MTRRELLELALAAPLAAASAHGADETKNGIPYRTLGKTGEKVSAVGIGGFHMGQAKDENESIAIVRAAVDGGINFLDNSWDYNDGASETRMGKALSGGYRSRVFLMTKIDGRTKQTAANQIDESLMRLKTDHVDLMQFHEVIRMEDADRIFAKGGAMEAMLAAKKAGKVRYIGFTGHKSPDIHLHMLDVAKKNGFAFDTVQMPLNVMDAHDAGFQKRVLPVLKEQGTGILGMKPIGGGFLAKSKAVTPEECLRYALSLPVSVVITGCDSLGRVTQALTAARTYKPYTAGELAALLARSEPEAKKGELERYKHSDHFDATAKHPEWLG
jgi:aryl-alcohol dehydrogenase-like predicted oxidoreductase